LTRRWAALVGVLCITCDPADIDYSNKTCSCPDDWFCVEARCRRTPAPTPSDGAAQRSDPSPSDAGSSDGLGDASLDGPATITFIQANAAGGQNSQKTAVAFIMDVRPHSSVIVALALTQEGSQTLASVTDSMGSTYTILAGPYVGTFPAPYAFYLVAAFDVTGGPSVAVTATLSAVTNATEVNVHEYAGIGSFGAAAFNKGEQSGSMEDGMTAGPLATTTARELLFAYGASASTRPGNQFTQRSLFDDSVTEDRLAPTPGSYAVTGNEERPGLLVPTCGLVPPAQVTRSDTVDGFPLAAGGIAGRAPGSSARYAARTLTRRHVDRAQVTPLRYSPLGVQPSGQGSCSELRERRRRDEEGVDDRGGHRLWA
jgi:hypothetical protein